jgi:predicted AAA+ superfamily ATPase
LREWLDAMPGLPTVVIDEVQKVPALLDVLHGLLEDRPGLRFVLTGSSAHTIRRGSWNLLAGRLGEAMNVFILGAPAPAGR